MKSKWTTEDLARGLQSVADCGTYPDELRAAATRLREQEAEIVRLRAAVERRTSCGFCSSCSFCPYWPSESSE